MNKHYSYCLAGILLMLSWATSAQSLTIEDAVSFWKLNGQKFSHIQTCSSLEGKRQGHQRIFFASTSCVLSDFATYVLAKECQASSPVNQIGIFQTENQKELMRFTVSPETCRLVNAPSSLPRRQKVTQQSEQTPISNFNPKRKRAYVIQFFSGPVAPKEGVNKCVDIPLYIHEVNGTYYLFSQLFNQYRQTKQVFNSLKRRCPETSMWIRPVTVS
ncbi:TPA: hypothetical protein N2696_004537 [Vibrio parahaemolyticus]|uniref:SPOR domain-containing protein n=1 Tax=Vibrio owensii TaxID=696485 RepID=A0AAP9KDT6_9VIBR|nr:MULTISPECIES: hypothetical protein [Vibrio harveyi group]MBD6947156.1 hypothetical protein [Vibrio parahaemolyticus]MBD6979389.1 hypothetical protein [Vibrio parahaemolyticus]MBD6983927.1 hypothetical protein [Vibrio parahaemolyticus]MBD6988402.1 hypothetical protein [Vibrio parahaemolyticus]MBD6989970.1 hypothetical protein [Vibrio parahaemolyticus]